MWGSVVEAVVKNETAVVVELATASVEAENLKLMELRVALTPPTGKSECMPRHQKVPETDTRMERVVA